MARQQTNKLSSVSRLAEPDTTLIQEPQEWQFKLGIFLSKNRVFFKRMFYFILFFIDIIVLSNLALQWIDYQAGQKAYEKTLQIIGADLIDYRTFRVKNTPEAIQVLSIQAIEAGQNSYDLIANIQNTNQDWVAGKLVFRFRVGGQVTSPRQTYILPAQTKWVTSFNFVSDSALGNIDLDIIEIGWKKAWDVKEKTAIYDQIEISGIVFTPSEEDRTSHVEWQVTNKTAYNFWSIGFQVIVYDAMDEIIGLNYHRGDKIRSLDTRSYSVRWFDPLPAVRRVEVIAEVNVFDDSVYMPIDY